MSDKGVPGGVVKILGFGLEIQQTVGEFGGNGYESGFSHEDLPSNSAGVEFAAFAEEYLKEYPNESLADAFGAWAALAGATESTNPEYQKAKNGLPATDPASNGTGDSNSTSTTGSKSSEPNNSN